MEICQICQEKNPVSSHFWKTHKISEKNYYLTYYNRTDLLTGEQLPFKNRDTYLSTYFLNKRNMKEYVLNLPTEKDRIDFCTYLLMQRKKDKDLIYVPTQVELKTSTLPPRNFFDSIDDYKQICFRLGFKERFQRFPKKKPNNKLMIQIDTREQKVFKFDIPYEIATLNYGDYRLNDRNYCNIVIERKSMNDFVGSLSRNFDRLTREMERAEKNNAYVVVVVEQTLSTCMVFNKLHVFKSVKATPDYIFHNVRELLSKFKNLQFLFVAGRNEAQRVIQQILLAGNYYQGMDLQYEYEQCNL